ncbi:3-dehydroquinate synthase [archaeon]|nr:3-dehydroquinate synthase [archaeon]
MQRIKVALGARSYSIVVASGLEDTISEHLPTGKKTLITTKEINKLYGERVAQAIGEHTLILVPDGEDAKQWSVLEKLLGDLLDAGMDRGSTIIALGGGSVGDLAGFAASIYMRGIKIVQIPTTLLAMVDSSIGGKTAINHPRGKNLVGSFWQPSLVLIDPLFLETLPKREIRSGLAEVIKYGVINDPDLFKLLESKNPESLMAEDMVEIVARCAATKARYVEQDEEDRLGIRAALNYGHTVGHAVEKLTDHDVNHGEGVAVGMVVAALISLEHGLLREKEYQRIIKLIEDYGLPTKLPEIDFSEAVKVMHKDKKAESGNIVFVLPTGIGKAPVLRQVGEPTIRKALEANR